MLCYANIQQVETCQEKIFSLELEDPKSLESPLTPTSTPITEQFISSLESSNLMEQQQCSADESDDNQSMVTVCPNNTEDTLILHPTDPSDYINANVNTLMSSDDQHDDDDDDDDGEYEIEYSNQINTIVQVVNPLLVGDGAATEIAIGHSDDLSSFNNELEDYGNGITYRQELSLNDKMKNVLKELKQNEKVRLSWSRSMEEDDDEDIENFEKHEKECEENDDNNIVSTSYEEKTGSIGTVFMVRERLINDFYDHQPQQQDIDNQASIDSCQVYSNPSVDEFLAHEIEHSTQESLSACKEALTLDLTATTSLSNENGDEDDENDDDEDTSTTDNTPSTPTKSLVQEESANVGSSNTNNNPSKKKRRKGKNKSKK